MGMGKIKKISALFAIMGILGLISPLSSSALLLSDPSGLSATADFTLINPNTLQIVLTNTSTGYPSYFEGAGLNSNILLTSIAFNLGGISILGGSVIVPPGSSTVNFDDVGSQLTGGADISVEWGYGNAGTTGFGSLVNYVSAMQAGTTSFQSVDLAHPNLDGSDTTLNGPQGGLISDTLYPSVGVGGLGAVLDSVTITLDLSDVIDDDLSFLDNGVIVEFGSDAAFVPVPEPATMLLFGSGLIGLAVVGRKKFRKN